MALRPSSSNNPAGLGDTGVIPISTYLTFREFIHKRGPPEALALPEEMGRHVWTTRRIDYIRRPISIGTNGAIGAGCRSIAHEGISASSLMSLYARKGGAEGMSHVLVLGISVYFAATGRIRSGSLNLLDVVPQRAGALWPSCTA